MNAALAIVNFSLGKTTVAAGIATTAMTVLRTAMLLTGIGAALVALGLVIDGITGASDAAEDGTEKVRKFGYAVKGAGDEADYVGGKFGYATSQIKGFNDEVAKVKPDLTGYMDAGERRNRLDVQFAQSGMERYNAAIAGTGASSGASGGGVAAQTQTLKQRLALGVKEQKLFDKLTTTRKISEEFASSILGGPKGLVDAKKIVQGTQKNANALQKSFNKTAAGKAAANAKQMASDAAADSAAQELLRIQEENRRIEEARLAEQARIYKSFADSVVSTFSSIRDSIVGAFSLPELGGSTDSIIRNMDKLLARVKSFSANITKLSSMGLDPELLQQVISAGPVAGSRLAAGLVAGGAGALARINAGFGEIGALGSQIATTGTESRFMTERQQNIYNINVDGGVGSGATIGRAIVEAIKAYERTSGAVWQGA
jgi:hypothetical protein